MGINTTLVDFLCLLHQRIVFIPYDKFHQTIYNINYITKRQKYDTSEKSHRITIITISVRFCEFFFL